MPLGSIQDKKWTYDIYRDFICGNQKAQLNVFLQRLNSHTGMNFHIASNDTIPRSIWAFFSRAGVDFVDRVALIVYGNNF